MSETNEMEAVIAAAERAVDVRQIDPTDINVTVDREGIGRLIDVDRFLYAPRRISGQYVAHDVASLMRYADEFRSESLTLWIDEQNATIVAITNDSRASAPAWGDHRVKLALRKTDEWLRWEEHDGALRTQEEMAQLIEEGQLDITDPPGAEMLELVKTLYVSSSAHFKSGINLQDGTVKFTYEENDTTTAGVGELEIPRSFRLGLKPFVGEQPYEVEALLRWRRTGPLLLIGYQLVRPQDVLQDALEQIANRLREGENEIDGFTSVYMGVPAGAVTSL